MECPNCRAETYTAIGGKQICPQCGYGASHPVPPPPKPIIDAPPERQERPAAEAVVVPPERRAYREAGHAVMAFLIRYGFTTRLVPIDRSLILPEFGEISIEADSPDWGQTTFSLGSLLTVPQVLIAGDVAEYRHFAGPRDQPLPRSNSVKRAEHLLLAYLHEYGGGDFERLRQDVVHETDEALQTHWRCVQVLAAALLVRKSIGRDEAFAIIGQQIPDAAKQQARIVLEAAARRFWRK